MAEDTNTANASAADEKPDSRRVKIQRVGKEPATCIPYEDGSGTMQQWYPATDKNEFEVPAIIAVAAVASGFFAEEPNSKTKIKKS